MKTLITNARMKDGKLVLDLDPDALERIAQGAVRDSVRDGLKGWGWHKTVAGIVRGETRQALRELLQGSAGTKLIGPVITEWLDAREGWAARQIQRGVRLLTLPEVDDENLDAAVLAALYEESCANALDLGGRNGRPGLLGCVVDVSKVRQACRRLKALGFVEYRQHGREHWWQCTRAGELEVEEGTNVGLD